MGTDVHKTLRVLLSAVMSFAIVFPCFLMHPRLSSAEGNGAISTEQKPLPVEASTSDASGPSITGIGVVKDAKGTSVTINGDAVLQFEYSVIEGKNLIIDVIGAGSKVWPDVQQIDDPFVSRIRISEIAQPKKMVRVVFDLMSAGAFTVKDEGSKIMVQFGSRPGTAGVPAAQDGPVPAQNLPTTGLNRVSGLDFKSKDKNLVFGITVKTDTSPEYIVENTGDPRQISVLITNALLERSAQQGTDLTGVNTIVSKVKVFQEKSQPPAVRVLADLLQPAPFHVSKTSGGIAIDVSVPQPANARPMDSSDRVAGGARAVASLRAEAPSPSVGALPEKNSNLSSPTGNYSTGPSTSERMYSGSKISLDFVDSDLQDIFRLISDVSGVSIIFGEDVKGKRTVQLQNIPWDQALEMILRTNNPPLDKIQESNNIIRIVTAKSIMDEKIEAEKKKIDIQKLADSNTQNAIDAKIKEIQSLRELEKARVRAEIISKGLTDKTFLISYADMDSVSESIATMTKIYDELFSSKDDVSRKSILDSKMLEDTTIRRETSATTVSGNRTATSTISAIPGIKMSYASCPGCLTQVDKRTSTMFVRTYPYYMEQYELIIAALDKPTPSIMIEARIVEVQSSYEENLGIQWGATANKDAAHGNATPYVFPNSVNIAGTQSDGTSNYMVNLPATNAVAGIGISFGSIADTLSLNLKLSALEKMGKTKVLSNPKLLAVQGQESSIQIGQQLPFVSNSTGGGTTTAGGNVLTQALTTTEWKDVGIILKVTPRLTYDNRVYMDLHIEKSSKGTDVTTTEGVNYSVDMNKADVKALIDNGSTAVIGGLFTETTSNGTDGVPGLSDIPVLGWLFKSKRGDDARKEMMIFITPRIVQQ